jgi:predicted dehydrogenase
MSPRERGASPVGVAIVGFGYMGRTHLAAYRAAHAAGLVNRVHVVCDPRLARGGRGSTQRGNLASGAEPAHLEGVERVAEAERVCADPRVELVSVCTPTDTHVALARAALRAGKHVLLEKPVALEARAVAHLAAAARAARRHCLPAMCMRFWPGWAWLAAAIRARTFGPAHSAVFRRLAAPPAWARDFYGDPARSGGALFDLHVHDADFVRHCFGAPASLASTGSRAHVTTLYRFPNGPAHVVAEGGWDHAPGFPFAMGFTVVFARATVEFVLGREPELVLVQDGVSRPVVLPQGTGYDGEVRHALAVVRGRVRPRVGLDEAVGLTRMLQAEARSLASGRVVRLER